MDSHKEIIMKYTKEITIEVKACKCDFCDNENIINHPMLHNQPYINFCAICQKDICNDHTGQAEDDGCLCLECSKKYKIVYPGRGVGVIDKNTKKYVSNNL